MRRLKRRPIWVLALAAVALTIVGARLPAGEGAAGSADDTTVTTLPGDAAAGVASLRAVPLAIPFQGFLRDSADQPVSGNVTLHVALYDSPAPGATRVWGPEVHGPIPVIEGVFQIQLGAAGQPLEPADFTGSHPLWLGVSVFPEAELPRVQLMSAPFAIRALEADHAIVADAATGAGIPTGAVLPYGGQVAPPGYLLCNGQEVSRVDYDDLFLVVGTTYGNGNGITTFNVPDLRQRFPMGLAASGTGSVMGGSGGVIDHVHQYSQVINHTHTGTTSVFDHGTKTTTMDGLHPDHIPQGAGSWGAFGNKGERYNNGNHTHTVTIGTHSHTVSVTNPTGGVTAGMTALANPPFLTVTYIIKT